MSTDNRQQLLAILAELDQMSTGAEAILPDPADSENLPIAEQLCELLSDMRTKVEEKLE